MHGDAVGRVGRIVHVAQTQVDGLAVRSGRMPMVGVIVQTHRIAGCQTLHLGRVEIKQIRLTVMLGLPPFRQIGHAGHIVGNDRVVEVEQILVGHGIRQLAGAARIIGGILENVAVFAHEVVVTETLLNIALDQTLANQEVARLSGLMRPHCTARSCTIGRPYSSTRAVATAEPREPDQCGSAYVVRVNWPANGSAHAGSMAAE